MEVDQVMNRYYLRELKRKAVGTIAPSRDLRNLMDGLIGRG